MKNVVIKVLSGIFIILVVMSILSSTSEYAFAQEGYPPPQQTPSRTVQPNFPTIRKVYLPTLLIQRVYFNKSYYVTNLTNMAELGRLRGQQNANMPEPITDLAILFFGSPQVYGNQDGSTGYGTLLLNSWNPTYVLNANIQSAVQEFIAGYLQGSAGNPTSYLNVVVAVNSSGMWINTEHGKAWGDMVEYLNYDWLPLQIGASQVHIYGGMDIEPGDYPAFNSPLIVKKWLKGYATIDSSHRNMYRQLIAIAAASGCLDTPDKSTVYGTPVAPGSCGSYDIDNIDNNNNDYTWTQEDIYQLTWGLPIINSFPDIYPIPQIYTQPSSNFPQNTNGINASQWYKIALYTYLKHYGITIHYRGIITQQAACYYNTLYGNYDCFDDEPKLDLPMEIALFYFKSELLSDPFNRMFTNDLTWKTDVGYYEGQP